MKLNAPTKIVWLISLILAVVSIAAHFVAIPVVTGIQYWVMTAAWGLLLLSTYFKNL
jgi:hypothetical protein